MEGAQIPFLIGYMLSKAYGIDLTITDNGQF